MSENTSELSTESLTTERISSTRCISCADSSATVLISPQIAPAIRWCEIRRESRKLPNFCDTSAEITTFPVGRAPPIVLLHKQSFPCLENKLYNPLIWHWFALVFKLQFSFCFCRDQTQISEGNALTKNQIHPCSYRKSMENREEKLYVDLGMWVATWDAASIWRTSNVVAGFLLVIKLNGTHSQNKITQGICLLLLIC